MIQKVTKKKKENFVKAMKHLIYPSLILILSKTKIINLLL